MALTFLLRSKAFMKKYLRFVLPAIAIVFLVNASAGVVSAQDVLRQILKRMDENNKSLSSLKGSIKMAKHDSVLNETDIFEGSINYIPGRSQNEMYIRID